MGLSQSQLQSWRNGTAWTYQYTFLFTNITELILIILTCTIAFLQYKRNNKAGKTNHGYSKSIILQLVLMFVSALLYSIQVIYMVSHGINYSYRNYLKTWVYVI